MGLVYYLDSGTLVGLWRCADVLPWSEDADIHVPAKDIKELFLRIFGRPQSDIPDTAMDTLMVTHEDNPIVPEDLVIWPWGWENGMGKSQPIGIADRSTGFYVDVWIEEQGEIENGTEWVERYWKHAPAECSPKEGYTTTRCFKFPREMVYPLADCKVDGVIHSCPRDSLNYLYIEYGQSVKHAPVQYRPALIEY